MAQLNPAIQAYFLYLNAMGLKRSTNRLKNTFINEKETLDAQSKQRTEESEYLYKLWDLYRTGNIKESRTQQLRTAVGATLSGASALQRSMSINYMLTSLPMLTASLMSGGVDLLNKGGIHNNFINSIGASAANFSNALRPVSNVFRYAQYVNPVYAASDLAMKGLFTALKGVMGDHTFLLNLVAPYASMIAYPLISKVTNKMVKLIAGGSISKKHQIKLKPISIDAKLYNINDFINKKPIQEVNELLNQVYALDPEQKSIDPVQNAQLQYLAEIAAYTSSIPILSSEIINNFIKKDTYSALTYNRNLSKLETYYKGKEYRDVIEKHADRLEHGQFAHTITENIGLAATEFSSFLHKLSIMLDPIKQIQMVLSGQNIKDEINKFNKAFQTIEQRKSAIFAKKMGIGEEESYINMYFSLTEDSQSILSRAKSFEDAQIGLMAGIYEFTRLSALELATLRTKAYGIKEPVKYNVIGNVDAEAKGLLDWLSNKIPMFEFIRMISSGALNIARMMIDKVLPDKGAFGKIKDAIQFIIGKPRVFRYHDEYLNRLAEGFDLRRETSLLERVAEPFIDVFNKALLKIPVLRIFGNENRMSLEERAQIRYQEKMAKGIDAVLKEMGFEKLEDQQLYYRYATSTMPEQFDLMIHHLSNIALFTHAIMLNTAALSKTIAGGAHIAEANTLVKRSINKYTGRLETEKESIEFQKAMFKAVHIKLAENARESKKSWSRAIDSLLNSVWLRSRKGIEEDKMLEGMIDAFYEIFKREKNTAEEIWTYVSEMMYRPLFTKEFLDELRKDKDFRKEILKKEIDKENLLKSSNKYGLTNFEINELADLESQMMKVDVAKITAPELLEFMGYKNKSKMTEENSDQNTLKKTTNDLNKIDKSKNTENDNDPKTKNFTLKVCNSLYSKTIAVVKESANEFNNIINDVFKFIIGDNNPNKNTNNFSPAIAVDQHGWRVATLFPNTGNYTGMRRSTFFGNLSPDNTIKGVEEALENEKLNLEKKQTEKLTGIERIMKDIKKLLSFQHYIIPKNKKTLNDKNEGSGFTGSPIKTAIAAAAATVTAGAYGIYNANYGREKSLIDELDRKGVIEYNFFGNSRIIDWDIVKKLSLEQLTQLLAFDDWNDEDKKVLQELVSQKTKLKTVSDAQRKLIFKDQKEFTKFIVNRNKELKEKEGTIGYMLGKGVQSIMHGVDNILTFGGFLGLGNSKDRDLYDKLEEAGVIRYSILPFVESEIRDWDTITKLNAEQLKSLLELNWDYNTKKQLRELLSIREKQKNTNNTTDNIKNSAKKMFDSAKNFFSNAFNKAKNFVSNTVTNVTKEIHNFFDAGDLDNLISDLSSKGIISKTPQGLNITNWDEIYKLPLDKIKSLIQYSENVNADSIKQKLQSIYNFKIGKQIADEQNTKNIPNPMKSKVDLESVVNVTGNQDISIGHVAELLETLIYKIDQLIAVTSAGHAKQVAATLQIVKNQNNNDDGPNHPLIDN